MLTAAGLPFGAKAAQPMAIDAYPFHHDQKNAKVFWDVRRVSGAAQHTTQPQQCTRRRSTPPSFTRLAAPTDLT